MFILSCYLPISFPRCTPEPTYIIAENIVPQVADKQSDASFIFNT